MTAIKNWFLEKSNCRGFRGKELETIRETEKAVLFRIKLDHYTIVEKWIPKSCIIDEWEKDTSNFGYHDYLVEVLTKAYHNGTIENHQFKSGRNIYDSTSFLHQETTKGLILRLEESNIEYMNRQEWNAR